MITNLFILIDCQDSQLIDLEVSSRSKLEGEYNLLSIYGIIILMKIN
jgi:hypothetical protein